MKGNKIIMPNITNHCLEFKEEYMLGNKAVSFEQIAKKFYHAAVADMLKVIEQKLDEVIPVASYYPGTETLTPLQIKQAMRKEFGFNTEDCPNKGCDGKIAYDHMDKQGYDILICDTCLDFHTPESM